MTAEMTTPASPETMGKINLAMAREQSLTDKKTDSIKQRGYTITGCVLTHASGKTCINNLGNVRWFDDPHAFMTMMNPENPPLPEQSGFFSREAMAAHSDMIRTNLPDSVSIEDIKANQEYQQSNPLGGPAKVFDAMADAIRAGDSYESVLRQFGYQLSKQEQGEPVADGTSPLTNLWFLINQWRDAPAPALHICGKINSLVLDLVQEATRQAKQEQGEPMAIVCNKGPKFHHVAILTDSGKQLEDGAKLYTTPQQRKPLTDEQRKHMWHKANPAHKSWASFDWYSQGVADTEAAHGIKE